MSVLGGAPAHDAPRLLPEGSMKTDRIERLTREALGNPEPFTLPGDWVELAATIALIVVAVTALAEVVL